MSETLRIVLPQAVLAGLACLFILGGTFRVAARVWGPLALVALVLAAGALYAAPASFGSALAPAADAPAPISLAVKAGSIDAGIEWACLVVGAFLVLISWGPQSRSKTAAEFYGLLLLLLSGVLLVAVANDLILLFLALELISIPTYVLLYLGRHDTATQEAATKYFLLSVASAAVLLYGFAFLYGLTGSTRLDTIRDVLRATYHPAGGNPPLHASSLGVIALVLIFAGLGFKVAAVPFHFYAPDVYEGTSAFNAGLLAVMPKIAGFVALIRVGSETLPGFEGTGQQLALILAAITMTGGNCLALWQTNIRRLLAYSSIAHAGYILIGLAVAFWESRPATVTLERAALAGKMVLPGGVNASLFYLLVYSVTNVGLFGALVYLAKPGREVDHIEELTGLGKTHPLLASAMALFLFSLAGIPPLPGFWAKLSIFTAALSVRQDLGEGAVAIHPAFLWLAVIGVLNAAVGAVYYLRLIALMFLNDPLSVARPAGGRPAYVGVLGSAVLVLALGIMPGPVFEYLLRPREGAWPAAARVIEAERPVADGS